MGEKFEGERGCWNPTMKLLYLHLCDPHFLLGVGLIVCRFSKDSKEITIPSKIKLKIPLIFLDGELWYKTLFYFLFSFFLFLLKL
jgi:hypothetical protein